MSMNIVPTAWSGCQDILPLTKRGNPFVSGVLNPVVDLVHSEVMNGAYQSRGRFLGQAPGQDIKVKLSC